MERAFIKDGVVVVLSPLQISQGIAQGLQELTEAEKQAHLRPTPVLTAEALKDSITQKRRQIETGGITLPTGERVATGIDDQNRITSVIANARLAGLETVSFKAVNCWITLTLAELEVMATAITKHVQECFSAERAHHEAIDAIAAKYEGNASGLDASLESYDVAQGWPSNHKNLDAGGD